MNGNRRCLPLCSLLKWRTTPTLRLTTGCTLGNYGCDSGTHVFSSEAGLERAAFQVSRLDRPLAQRGDLAITTMGRCRHVDYTFAGNGSTA